MGIFDAVKNFISPVPELLPGQRCAWCKAAIGEVEHAPVPLCAKCFRVGLHEKKDAIREFDREMRVWVRRQMARPTITDFTTDSNEAFQDVLALQKRARAARAAGDEATATELDAKASQLTKSISRFRTETQFIAQGFDLEERQ